MTLTIELSVELEDIIRQRASRAGIDIETFVSNLVANELGDEMDTPPRHKVSHEEFQRRLDQFIRDYGVHNGNFDDSRESIYAGRGE